MHASRITFALALAAAVLAAATPADAGPARFAGNVCRLLTAKQVTAVAGVSSRCTNARPMTGPGTRIYTGNWAGKTPRSPRLQVTISVYADAGALRLAKQNLDQGLSGTPKKVRGIGGGAYEAGRRRGRGHPRRSRQGCHRRHAHPDRDVIPCGRGGRNAPEGDHGSRLVRPVAARSVAAPRGSVVGFLAAAVALAGRLFRWD